MCVCASRGVSDGGVWDKCPLQPAVEGGLISVPQQHLLKRNVCMSLLGMMPSL